jgi:hypothetical protein
VPEPVYWNDVLSITFRKTARGATGFVERTGGIQPISLSGARELLRGMRMFVATSTDRLPCDVVEGKVGKPWCSRESAVASCGGASSSGARGGALRLYSAGGIAFSSRRDSENRHDSRYVLCVVCESIRLVWSRVSARDVVPG